MQSWGHINKMHYARTLMHFGSSLAGASFEQFNFSPAPPPPIIKTYWGRDWATFAESMRRRMAEFGIEAVAVETFLNDKTNHILGAT